MTEIGATGVWISAASARIIQWSPDLVVRHRIDSNVRGRHRATGHAPTQQHGQSDGQRDEHLRAFFDRILHVLSLHSDLLLVGDGEIVGQFAELLRADDTKHGRDRRIEVVQSEPLTEGQLIARIRMFAGHPPVRRRVGRGEPA